MYIYFPSNGASSRTLGEAVEDSETTRQGINSSDGAHEVLPTVETGSSRP